VECAQIDALLEEGRASSSGVLVLRGEAGIGKSALLEHAIASAQGMAVLKATGVEGESELAFAGLDQLLRPVLGHLDDLPPQQRRALAGALGLEPTEVSDRFLASIALLSVLAEAAEQSGLLCVVDDAHWLDEPSLGALLFVARRLEAEGVVMLLAVRLGEERGLEGHGLPELMVEGLAPEAATALLAERAGPDLPTVVHERLVGFTRGNPLALVELPGSLTPEQLAGRELLLEPLPVGEGVTRAFLGRIEQLDERAQLLLLLAAADDSGDLAAILRAAELLGVDVADLDTLQATGLARVEGTKLVFRHPLVRSAVYRSAAFSRRETAHLALAEALPDEADADRRAWHLAAASPGSNSAAAAELESSAVRARLRGGHAAAATALERAAHLSEDDASRGRRLLAAAEANWIAGRAQRAGPLVEQAEPLLTDPALRARAAMLRGSHEFERGVLAHAFEVFVTGAHEHAARDPRAALEMLVRAAETAQQAGNPEWAAQIAALAQELVRDDHVEEQFMVALLRANAGVMSGDYSEAPEQFDRAYELADGFEHPRYLLSAAMGDILRGDVVGAYGRRARAVALLRAAGAIGELPLYLELLAGTEVWLGRFSAAAATAGEGLRLSRATGQDMHVSFQLAGLARVDAARGNAEDCAAHAGAALELSAARGLTLSGSVALWALGILELGRGRHEEAVRHLHAIAQPGSGFANPVTALYSAPDLVEAAVRCGRPDVAGAAHDRFAAWADWAPATWTRASSLRSQALLADDDDEADALFGAAVALEGDNELAFEAARTRLLYGEHLRRRRRPSDAREHLRAALTVFERFGAAAFAERAGGELRATGETARRRDPSTLDQLTPQELQIARFVSEGATNREVASRLFLSPRTVEYHLRKVFMKLGISSRGELARMLPDEAPAPAGVS